MPDILRTRNLQNRTDEFRSLTSVLRSRQAKSKSQQQQSTPPAPPRPSQSAHSQFSRQAIEIGLEIKQVAQELEQLALLARRKTLFDDRSTEIANLTNKVKGRIAGINTKITTLQRTSQSQPTKQRQLAEHNANVVMSLQSQLATTSTTFKDVLELRSQNLKASSDRRDQLMVPNKGPGFISSGKQTLRIGVAVLQCGRLHH
ncbi:Integral membrane protein SED5 [Spiromyces aspiralis]|uniref:Integral membrane protein SED5 n=1 Tax=Spiromyces aspiralis TaxID=68401 RepID=A0ACC1HDA8_9FUNG|nr:Integral membrane protein SED5 [Spiromyces aspiralis]